MKEPTNEEIKSLSKREIDIINLLAQNQNSKQIAKKLLISHHTVNTHRKNILKKNKNELYPRTCFIFC